jgi:hypothetical protein
MLSTAIKFKFVEEEKLIFSTRILNKFIKVPIANYTRT